MEAHLGPLPVPKGTLTGEQRQEIKEKTGCSAAIRERGQWGSRMLTIAGPSDMLQEAHRLAMKFVEENGEDGGRAPPEPAGKPKQSWQSDGWRQKDWKDWKEWSWKEHGAWHEPVPSKEEFEELQGRLTAAEQQLAHMEWRLSSVVAAFENWCFWQGAHQAEQQRRFVEARPASSAVGPERDLSVTTDVTRSPATESEATSPADTIVDAQQKTLKTVPEETASKRRRHKSTACKGEPRHIGTWQVKKK